MIFSHITIFFSYKTFFHAPVLMCVLYHSFITFIQFLFLFFSFSLLLHLSASISAIIRMPQTSTTEIVIATAPKEIYIKSKIKKNIQQNILYIK